jgi:hypothetical protein
MDLFKILESSHVSILIVWRGVYTFCKQNVWLLYSIFSWLVKPFFFSVWIITKSKLLELSESIVKLSPWLFKLDEIVIVWLIGILRNPIRFKYLISLFVQTEGKGDNLSWAESPYLSYPFRTYGSIYKNL